MNVIGGIGTYDIILSEIFNIDIIVYVINQGLDYLEGNITLDELYDRLSVVLTSEYVKYAMDYAPNSRYGSKTTSMSDIFVVSNAHHDSEFPHHADQYEPAEVLVTNFFEEPRWRHFLDNEYTNEFGAYNDGYATKIVYS